MAGLTRLISLAFASVSEEIKMPANFAEFRKPACIISANAISEKRFVFLPLC